MLGFFVGKTKKYLLLKRLMCLRKVNKGNESGVYRLARPIYIHVCVYNICAQMFESKCICFVTQID